MTPLTMISSRWSTALPLLAGFLLVAGLWTVLLGARRRPVSLAAALGTPRGQADATTTGVAPQGRMEEWGERLAARLGVHPRVARLLEVQGRSRGDFLAEKVIMAAIGVTFPALTALLATVLGLGLGSTPAWLALLGLVGGWFLPNLLLVRTRSRVRGAAGEAMFTYIDLVVLERLAGQSATLALTRAAALSDSILFRTLRTSLERARLEQRPAWQALEEVATRLELPQLRDIADVMRLDEQGAALGAALRARVRELRDSHLMHQKIEAQRVSESLTIWMVIPALVFGLILLTPPMLRMVGV